MSDIIITKRRFIAGVVFFVLAGLFVFSPIILSSDIRYFSIVYVAIIPVLLLTVGAPYLHPRRMWSYWLLIAFHLVLIFTYIGDRPSTINLVALMLSHLSLFYLVSKGMEICGEVIFVDMIFIYIAWILAAVFFISPILTALQWPPNAPSFFPWEAFYTDERLLLITGQNVGHSDSLWLIAFTLAFAMKKVFSEERQLSIGITVLILFLFLALVETKSRLALIFIGLLIIAWLCYQNVLSKRLYAAVVLIIPIFYYISIAIPTVTDRTISLVDSLQAYLPFIRISASPHLHGLDSVYVGRYELNRMLVETAVEHPLVGIGHSGDLMLFGVNKHGHIAYGGDAVSTTESGLRMLAKYGFVYYFLLLLFVFIPIIRAARGYYADNIFVISVCGIIVLSGIANTAFENLYGISGLYVILLLSFYMMSPKKNYKGRGLVYRCIRFILHGLSPRRQFAG